MTTPLLPERIQWLLENGIFHDEDAADMAAIYNTNKAAMMRAAHWLKEYARAKGEGYSIGDAHVYATRPRYQQVPDPQLVAEWLSEMEGPERVEVIRDLLEGKATGHYMTWCRKLSGWDFLQRYLDEQDGYIEAHGEPNLEIRASAPSPAYTDICHPVTLEPLEEQHG